MVTAMRVAGKKEGEGSKAMVLATRVAGKQTVMATKSVGSCYKIRSRTVSSLVTEYLVGGFMRWCL
jgi:hypothetical protein